MSLVKTHDVLTMSPGPPTIPGGYWVDFGSGLGQALAELGLILQGAKVTRHFEEFRPPFLPPGFPGLRSERNGIFLDLETQLHPDAVLYLKLEEATKRIILDIEFDDKTKEKAEALLPQVLECLRAGENGEFSKRSATLLGMLLMQMLWALASGGAS